MKQLAPKLKARRKVPLPARQPKARMFSFMLSTGEKIKVSDFSARQLDPQFAKESKIRARSLQKGFAAAVRMARKKGVPLGEILPVS
jgi:uncharacterized pyridoxamine 5'-phosphate oxidase family protein